MNRKWKYIILAVLTIIIILAAGLLYSINAKEGTRLGDFYFFNQGENQNRNVNEYIIMPDSGE